MFDWPVFFSVVCLLNWVGRQSCPVANRQLICFHFNFYFFIKTL